MGLELRFDFRRARRVNSISLLGGRPMVGLQTLDLAIGVRVPASQPKFSTSANFSGLTQLISSHGLGQIIGSICLIARFACFVFSDERFSQVEHGVY